jgi:hypothetical protein
MFNPMMMNPMMGIGMGMGMGMNPMMNPMMGMGMGMVPGVMPGMPGMGMINSMPGRFGRDMLGRGRCFCRWGREQRGRKGGMMRLRLRLMHDRFRGTRRTRFEVGAIYKLDFECQRRTVSP